MRTKAPIGQEREQKQCAYLVLRLISNCRRSTFEAYHLPVLGVGFPPTTRSWAEVWSPERSGQSPKRPAGHDRYGLQAPSIHSGCLRSGLSASGRGVNVAGKDNRYGDRLCSGTGGSAPSPRAYARRPSALDGSRKLRTSRTTVVEYSSRCAGVRQVTRLTLPSADQIYLDA